MDMGSPPAVDQWCPPAMSDWRILQRLLRHTFDDGVVDKHCLDIVMDVNGFLQLREKVFVEVDRLKLVKEMAGVEHLRSADRRQSWVRQLNEEDFGKLSAKTGHKPSWEQVSLQSVLILFPLSSFLAPLISPW
jgi:hypothetical protein